MGTTMGELMSFLMCGNVGWGMIPLVDELVSVSIEPSLWRHGSLVEMIALVAALAGLDEHNGPVEAFAIWAGKGHAGSTRATR